MTAMQRLNDLAPRKPLEEGTPKWREAHLYLPHPELVEAIEVAMALQQPLLITGEPGGGKTSAAYWAAWRLGLSPDDLVVEQVRSDATAARMRYEFDAVAYFRESQASASRQEKFDTDRARFIRKGALWLAFERARERPTALLLDEIDKAPRDLPNDLLREFDELWFEVPDLGPGHRVDARKGAGHLALVVFTSNGERQLPDAFLRRCVHHHLGFDTESVRRVVEHRIERGDLSLSRELVAMAIERFIALRVVPGLRHKPGLSEFLVWLRVIAMAAKLPKPSELEAVPLGSLPYLGVLLKDPADTAAVKQRG